MPARLFPVKKVIPTLFCHLGQFWKQRPSIWKPKRDLSSEQRHTSFTAASSRFYTDYVRVIFREHKIVNSSESVVVSSRIIFRGQNLLIEASYWT